MESISLADQVGKEVLERSDNILRDWNLLNWLLRFHESTIRHRWAKRTASKRQRLLLEAWSGMPPRLRPDITADTRRSRGVSFTRDAFLWPHITLEALVPKSTLLIFLNSRGRHRPHLFIAADRVSAEFGILTGNVQKVSLDNHEIAFLNKAGGGYGKLMEHDPILSSNGQLKMNTGDGLLGLEIQERLYGFLVACAVSLLHDVSPGQYLSENLPEKPEPAPINVQMNLNQSVMTTRLTPYRLPADFDIKRLIALIDAKCAATEEHILAMREDPRYFAEVLHERREHRPELLRGADGREPQFLPIGEKDLWNKVIRSVLSDMFANLGMWNEIQRQLNSLMQLIEDLPEELTPEKPLPSRLEQAFCMMIWSLERMCRFPVAKLMEGLQSSPPMRPFFRQNILDGKIHIGFTPGCANDRQRSELLRILLILYNQQARSLYGLPTLMDTLETLIQREQSIKELISSYVKSTISDLSVLTECLREISAFQPWAANFETAIAKHSETLGRNWNATAKEWILFGSDSMNFDFAAVGAPTGTRFSYPADKPRSAKSTAEMQTAEKNLDTFWTMVDAQIRERGGNFCVVLDSQISDMSRSMHRTLDWVDPEMSERQQIITKPEKFCVDAQSLIDFELKFRTEGTFGNLKEPNQSKPIHGDVKVKSRGSRQEAPLNESVARTEETIQKPRFTVSLKALKVFKMLFSTSVKGSQPGELDWKDFLKTMAEAGFEGHRLHGSAWQFTQSEYRWSIQIHEPHPRPKLDFWSTRQIGRRLTRRFGLDITSFHHESE